MLAVIAAVITAVVAVVVVHGHSKVPSAGETPGYSQAPLTAAPISPSSGSTSSPVKNSDQLPSGTKIAFVGDNYTLGIGASSPDKGFAPQVASDLKVTYQSFGIDGAGYAKAGANGQNYSALVAQVAAAKPTVVVVTGGRNDKGDDPASAKTAVNALFTALADQVTGATLVAVNPFWGDSAPPGIIETVAAAVHDAVDAAKGIYLALNDPLRGHSDYMADAANPNDKGYAAIAAALAPVLLRALVKSAKAAASSGASSGVSSGAPSSPAASG